MGRKNGLQPRRGRNAYRVRFRRQGDRLDRYGNTIEGGVIFARHFEANDTAAAERVARKLASKIKCKIISITKVHPEDIIGDHRQWGLENIIGKFPERRRDVIVDNATLDDILYNKKR